MPAIGFSRSLPVALLACCSGGCLFVHQNEKIVRQAEPRQNVQFESRAAEQAFKDRALDPAAREKAASEGHLSIPFLLRHSNRSVLSESAYYNDQIVTCDSNGDRMISEAEALAYNPRFQQRSGWSQTVAAETVATQTEEEPGDADSFRAPIDQAHFETIVDESPDDSDTASDSVWDDGIGEMPGDILDDVPTEMPGDLLDEAAGDLLGDEEPIPADMPDDILGDEPDWERFEEPADERSETANE